jgi:hypothetical protein
MKKKTEIKRISYSVLLNRVDIRPNLGTLEFKGRDRTSSRVKIYRGITIDEITKEMELNGYEISND